MKTFQGSPVQYVYSSSCTLWPSVICFLAEFNRPLSIYASVPAKDNLKSRLRAKSSYIGWIFWYEASTSCYCSRELKRNSKMVYWQTCTK